MNTIQAVLVLCTGTLADVHVTIDPSAPERFHVYWGTALLQVIPRDKNSLLFRIGVALLLNLKFRIGGVAKAFGVSEKPLRIWRDALKKGDWLSLGGELEQLQKNGKLHRDVELYIRARYRQACGENGDRMPYGFRKQLCDQIPTIWPDQKVCEETLRQLFRDEDAAGSAVKEATVNSDAEQQESPLDIGETVELTPSLPQVSSVPADITRLSGCQNIDHKRKSFADSIGSLRLNPDESRELACDSFLSVQQGPDSPDRNSGERHRPISGAKPGENQLLMDRDKIVS